MYMENLAALPTNASEAEGDRAMLGSGARPKAERRPRVAFYSHDTMGMGHLRRNLLLASRLASGPLRAETLLIAGAREAGYFAEQAGLDCVTLPSIAKDPTGKYSARNYDWTLEQTTQLRGRVIASTLLAFQPDIFVVDKLPQGICNELDRALKLLKHRQSTRCVLGLRDILDRPDVARREWHLAGNDQVIEQYFDEVWVYGDCELFDCRHEYGFSPATCEKIRFLGYLDQSQRRDDKGWVHSGASPVSQPYALCVVGGGQDGFQLASAFVQARMPEGRKGVVITGPFMPETDREKLKQWAAQRTDMEVIDQLVECDRYLASAERVVAMGGYNTVTSVLSFCRPALIVPRVSPREEQWIRAKRLEEAGLLSVCHPAHLSADYLSDWLGQSRVPDPGCSCLDLEGLQTMESVVAQWHPQAIPGLRD